MRITKALTLGCLILGATAFAASKGWSDEREELKAKIHALRQEAKELEQLERPDEARARMQEAQELMRHMVELSKRDDLRDETRRAGAKAEAQEQKKHLAILSNRVRYVRAAAENLKAAEMHDLAMELTHRADELEKDLRASKEKFAHAQPMRQMPEPPPEVKERLKAQEEAYRKLQETQRQVATPQEGVQNMVRKLSEENRQLRDEMNARSEGMQREMAELRGLIERMAEELKRNRRGE